jgi:hypothetical protein
VCYCLKAEKKGLAAQSRPPAGVVPHRTPPRPRTVHVPAVHGHGHGHGHTHTAQDHHATLPVEISSRSGMRLCLRLRTLCCCQSGGLLLFGEGEETVEVKPPHAHHPFLPAPPEAEQATPVPACGVGLGQRAQGDLSGDNALPVH